MGWTAIIVVHFWAGAGDFFFSMTITLAVDPLQHLLFGGPEAVALRLK
jgi:hypothetical protein